MRKMSYKIIVIGTIVTFLMTPASAATISSLRILSENIEGQSGGDMSVITVTSGDVVSFVQPLSGVDGDTSGWSTDDTVVNLGVSSWSLLGGTGTVAGYIDGHGILTHRGTRGLGVHGQEDDEVDSYDRAERIEITFDTPYILTCLGVRSLFDNDAGWHGTEEGDVDLYLDGSFIANYHLVGVEDFYAGTKGILNVPIPDITVDKIVFYVQQCQPYTAHSEFAVAKICVEEEEDNEPPVTTKKYGQPFYTDGIDDWITSDTLIWLNATDDDSGVLHTFYRILKWDGSNWVVEVDWTIYTCPFTIPTQCYHKIEFYSDDNACNTEETKWQTVYVDNTPPCSHLTVTDDPDRYVCHVSTITIESLDGGGPCAVGSYTLYCYINGDHYKTAHNHKISFQFNELYGFTEDGRYVVEYWAVDNLGNEESHNTESFFLDTTPPDTEYSFIGPNRWVNYHWQIEPTTKIVLNATDSGAGVDYTLYRLGYSDEGGDWETYTGPFIPDNENIFYASVDKVGNHENLVHLHVEIVDSITNKPPNIPEKPDGQNYGNTKTTYSYKTSTTDPEGDKIKYYFNWGDGTGEWTDFVNSGTQITRTHTWSRAGTYKIKIKAQDENGAESPWSTALTVYLINEDNKPPEKPDKPAGSANGKAGVEYTYYIKTIDPEDDLIYYLVDWGDGTDSGWIGPYESADTIYVKHIWMNSGSYSVKVKAMDYYGEKSDWSESLSVSMPRSKPLTLFNKLTTILEQHFPMLFKILIKMMVN